VSKRVLGCLRRVVALIVGACLLALPAFAQGGSAMFLLDLPGDPVGVRYSHGSLDRAVRLQENFELLVEDFRGWTRAKVGLVLFLLSREEWKELGYRNPYGIPEPAGGRGIALPAWGDDGTVEVWQRLLGTRLPVLPDQPLRGTPEQVASLAVGDLMASAEAARILLRSAGITGDRPWVDGVLAQLVVLSNVQDHHGDRLSDVKMVYADLGKAGGGPGAHRLSVLDSPPTPAARLWFESRFFEAASLLLECGGKTSAKSGGSVRAADLLARCPRLDDWLGSSFQTE
jgi:hypothetical protein